jgi:hypothetical protein
MKFTAIVMLGVVSAADPTYQHDGALGYRADQPVWGLRSVNDHRTDQSLQIDFGNHATSQANARPPLRSHV